MCGSGTLPIEAAWLALWPARPDAQAVRLSGLDGLRRRPVGGAARPGPPRRGQTTAGRPSSAPTSRGDAVAFSTTNARAAGIGHLLKFAVRDVRDFQPPDGPPGVLMCNPPYGERIGEEKEWRGLYRTLGEVFRQRRRGWPGFCVHRQPPPGGSGHDSRRRDATVQRQDPLPTP